MTPLSSDARLQEARDSDWASIFRSCDGCITETHCAHHRRCLAECVPDDLAEAPAVVSAHALQGEGDTPSLQVTRDAIIEVLVKHGVIGAREAVDRLIAAARDTAAWHEVSKLLKFGTDDPWVLVGALQSHFEQPATLQGAAPPHDQGEKE